MEQEMKVSPEQTVEVVDIQFRPGQKIYYFDPNGLTFQYAFVFDCTFVQQDEGVFVLQKCHPSLCPMLIYQKGAAFGREKK